MDEIKLTGLKIYAYHGVLKEEKEKGQDFLVDITLHADVSKAGKTDDLSLTTDYGEMALFAIKVFTGKSFDLIEAAAENLADSLLLSYDKVQAVTVTVHKPSAPIEAEFEDVSVTVTRGWHTAYIAVGSNMGDSKAIINRGREMLFKSGDIVDIKDSSYIITKPYGVTDQPDFVNGLWKVKTILGPEELLTKLHEVEAAEHRERVLRWGPRTLDLDIIYYDNLVFCSEDLAIPHVDMANREFVLKPLMEVDPYVRHPITGYTAEQMLKNLEA